MKVILEIDHTVSKEEVVNWIEEVLKPNTPCVWGYSFEEHHCGSCHNSQLEKELAESKAHIKTLQQDLKNMTKRCKDYEISTCKGCIYTELETDNEHCNHCYAGSRKNVS